ncbi:hypothetical protein ONZ51_g4170 [Trametes cubensis]|uniref:Uncharacterized protein n=1 Tax=Trametes cubensis TaxID=1111947 RepID=A0AAD7TYV0_9APHY|nr:hypothetical protein ONZ51_g4170 [Trametes cubensis]
MSSSSLATKALRRSLRRATPSHARHRSTDASSSSATAASSSQSKLDVKPQSTLPDDKMRVLVNLYHQSGSFITKENLSDRIDQAFAKAKHITVLGPESTLRSLQVQVEQRRANPKFGTSNQATPYREGELWSDLRPIRERAVLTTLFGMVGRRLPGYDVLKEEEERIKRKLKEAEEAQRDS